MWAFPSHKSTAAVPDAKATRNVTIRYNYGKVPQESCLRIASTTNDTICPEKLLDGRQIGRLSDLGERRDLTTATKVAALLDAIRTQDVAALPPMERRRFADLCRRVARLAEPESTPAKAGVLYDLRVGRRDD
jgi:hypothetical protein